MEGCGGWRVVEDLRWRVVEMEGCGWREVEDEGWKVGGGGVVFSLMARSDRAKVEVLSTHIHTYINTLGDN